MSLYFAPAPFFFLLGVIYRRGGGAGALLFLQLGAAVAVTFGVVWAPFVHQGVVGDAVTRLFPFNRGLYEDKVANVWCTVAPVFNFRNTVTIPTMARVSLLATLAALVPGCVVAFRARTWDGFVWGLVSTSFAFFLFSFQVHEKTILLPLLPLTLLATRHPLLALVGNTVATFSMYPLLHRDGLAAPYFLLQGAYLLFGLRSTRCGVSRVQDAVISVSTVAMLAHS